MCIVDEAYSLRDIWEHSMLPRAPQTASLGHKEVAYNFILYYKSWKANKYSIFKSKVSSRHEEISECVFLSVLPADTTYVNIFKATEGLIEK